ncbi:MAG TPA: hypothetical protein VFN67_36385 [Polyangiales bacterium]|nr:hypothetical protein [Polyangiales bacterium]
MISAKPRKRSKRAITAPAPDPRQASLLDTVIEHQSDGLLMDAILDHLSAEQELEATQTAPTNERKRAAP